MRATYLLSLFSALALADYTITFPFVGTGEAGATYTLLENYTATVITTQGSMTTYAVACATGDCGQVVDDKTLSITMAIGPNTQEVRGELESGFSSLEACTYSGTEAKCTATGKYIVEGAGNATAAETSTTSESYAVPTSNMVVQTATLKVVGGKGPEYSGVAVAGRAVEAWMVGAGLGIWGAFVAV